MLARRQPGFACEIVAFPQHGLLLSKSEPLMREAMQAGAHYVGGLDPTSVDGAMEKSLDTMFQIALDYDKGVDIHLHETSPAGVAAVNYMVETVEKTPQLKGKLTISHAFALATLNEQQVDALASRMAAQQITIASTVPIGTLHMPLKQLRDKGVEVITGTDSVIDHWSPYGLGDMLEKANLYAQLYIVPMNSTCRERCSSPPAMCCRLTIKVSASGRRRRMKPALYWWMPPAQRKRSRESPHAPRPSIKANWCGERRKLAWF